MPYKYIGKTHDFRGKTLWEIVGNLKNFGIGRFVVRSRFERYPEPSYFKILKVDPLACPEKETIDNVRKVRVLVERTFRGVTDPKPVTLDSASYKTDYRLLSKDEEKNYCQEIPLGKDIPVLPRKMELPPLLKELIVRENRNKGESIEDLEIDIVYKKRNNGRYRIAQEGENPTQAHDINIKKLPNLSFYQNVKVEI